MSGRAGVWRRPRTKVYDANFNAGESYYKSALEGLDRKYGRASAPPEPAPVATNGSAGLSALRASLERDRPARRPLLIEDEDIEDRPRRKTNTNALLDEFDSIFEGRSSKSTLKVSNGSAREKTPSRALQAINDEVDQDFEESMKRIRAARSARAAAEDMEEIDNNLSSRKKEVRAKLNFSSKVMDSVGLSEDNTTSRKKVLAIVASPNDSEDFTRWTKIDSGRRNNILDEIDGSEKAAERARKSRMRLEDLETEMAELEQRGAAREKRVRDLRSLLSENESNSKETIHSTVRVKSSIKTEKKQVAF